MLGVMSSELAALVRDVRSAIDGGDVASAVARLVAAWTNVPATALADAAVALSARLPVDALPSRVAEREARWLAIAAAHDPATLPTLLAAEWPVHPRAAKARLAELLKFPRDPRIARNLIDLWHAKRYGSNAGVPFWRATFKALFAWGEPGITPIYGAARKHEDLDWYRIFEDLKFEQLPAEPQLPAAIAESLADLANRRTTTSAATRDALFASVYDDPASDPPRAVLADALLGDGDPRGELIQLQLSGKRSAQPRTRALLRAHGATWLDGLEDAIVNPVFRRGFVAEATLARRPDDLTLPAWRTIEALHFACEPHDHRLVEVLLHPTFAAVRRITGVPATLVAPVLAKREAPIDHLGIKAPLSAIAKAPEVHELAVDTLDHENAMWTPFDQVRRWFVSSALRRTVRSLLLDRTEQDLAAALSWLITSDLARLTLRPGFAWELELTRTTLHATWHGRLYDERPPTGLGDALLALPADALEELVVTSSVKLDAALQQLLAKDLARGVERQRGLRIARVFGRAYR
jgi:uncharacterized protein (TIGR02996 family)